MSAAADIQTTKGRIEVSDFSLSYDTIDGAVEAVSDAAITVNPGEFVSIVGRPAAANRLC